LFHDSHFRKLTECERTVINPINFLLQLAMVGSYQQLHVSAFMEGIVRLFSDTTWRLPP